MDGNGRIGRFLMNAMLASGGYPWTIVRLSERRRYLHALEKASVHADIRDFAAFLAGEMKVDWASTEEAECNNTTKAFKMDQRQRPLVPCVDKRSDVALRGAKARKLAEASRTRSGFYALTGWPRPSGS